MEQNVSQNQNQMLSSDSLLRLDPGGIVNMEFNYKKVKKYTTVKSILVSLSILAITLILSWSTIANLWIPIKQLDIISYQHYQSQLVLSDTPICAYSNNTNTTLNTTFFVYGKSVPQLTQETMATKYKYMLDYIGDVSYQCYDLGGYVIPNKNQAITLFPASLFGKVNSIYILSSDNISIAVKLISTSELFQGQKPKIANYSLSSTLSLISIFKITQVSRYEICNQIIGDSCQTYTGISQIYNVYYMYQTKNIYGYEFINSGATEDQKGQYNMNSFKVVRKKLSQVLGVVMAWFGTILAIFFIIIEPIGQFGLKVEMSKNLLSNKILASIQPSILVQFKYYLSFIFKGKFKQEIIGSAFQLLEKKTNLVQMLKQQLLAKQIMPFLTPDKKKTLLQLPGHEEEEEQNRIIEKKKQQTILNFHEQQEEDNGWLINFIKGLDGCQNEIGLKYTNGSGYRSFLSLLVNIVGLGFLAFLIVYQNELVLDKQQAIYLNAGGNDDRILQTTINPQQMVFIAVSSSTAFNDIFAEILNQNSDVVQKIQLGSRENCMASYINLNLPNTILGNCFLKPIRLFYNPMTKTANYLRLRYCTAANCSYSPYGITLYLTRLQIYFNQSQPYQKAITTQIGWGTFLSFLQLKRIDIIDDGVKQENFNIFTGTRREFSSIGGAFQLTGTQLVFQYTKKTIWNAIDDIWGITIILFQLLIFKITRAINLRIKSWNSNSEKESERTNLLNLISNHHKITSGVFSEHLNPLQCYFKTNLLLYQPTLQ